MPIVTEETQPASGKKPPPPPEPTFTLGDDVLIDLCARYNEAIVSNIDAIDTALVGILALPVAFGIFAVDKIRDLTQPWEGIAITLLALSGLASSAGYAWGFLISGGRQGTRDGINPRRFLAQYSTRGTKAIVEAIQTLNEVSDQNSRIRRVKRWFALGALVLSILGAGTVLAARLGTAGADESAPPTAHAASVPSPGAHGRIVSPVPPR